MAWITGQFGFSYVGLLFLLMLMVPNLLWARRQPQGYDPSGENPTLLLMERVGEVLVTTVALIFTDFNLRPWSLWSLWLVAAAGFMLLYEGYWVCYFRSRRTLADFYRSFCGVPLAGATLPILAFFCLGLYGRVLWLLLAVVLLGVGHIGIHYQHAKALPAGE